MKVSELTGTKLDYWVARAEGWTFFWSKHDYFVVDLPHGFHRVCFESWAPFDPYTGAKKHQPYAWECMDECDFYPSTNWSQGGPIIERERISLCPVERGDGTPDCWSAFHPRWNKHKLFSANDPLTAAMRCFVASKFGDTVDDL